MISVTSHELDTYGGVTFYELRRGATSVVLSADSKHPAIAYLKRHPNQRIALQMSAEEKR